MFTRTHQPKFQAGELLCEMLPHIALLTSWEAAKVLAVPDFSTQFASGSSPTEEANVVLSAWSKWRLAHSGAERPFLAKLADGYVLFSTQDSLARESPLCDLISRHREYLQRGELDFAEAYVGATLVGSVAHSAAGWTSLLVAERFGGTEEAEIITRALLERGDLIAVPKEGPDLEPYLELGYQPTEVFGALQRLISPVNRPDLIDSATACLLNPGTRRVLIGKRLVGSYPGNFAFSGGKLNTGEDPLRGALRELEEETAIKLPLQAPVTSSLHYTGFPARNKAYRVHNFVFLTTREFEARKSDEMDCSWRAIAELGGEKMGIATRQILRGVGKLFHV